MNHVGGRRLFPGFHTASMRLKEQSLVEKETGSPQSTPFFDGRRMQHCNSVIRRNKYMPWILDLRKDLALSCVHLP